MRKTIKNLREAAGLSQIQLAQKAGLSRNFVSKLENNKRRITFSVAKKIGGALNEDPYEIQRKHLVQSLDNICDKLEYKQNRENFDLIKDTEDILTLWRLFYFLVFTIAKTPQTESPAVENNEESLRKIRNTWAGAESILRDYGQRINDISGEYIRLFLEAMDKYRTGYKSQCPESESK